VLIRIRRAIERFRMLEGARQVGVAVSGGADSICLLHVLGTLAGDYGIALSVLHVDHGLRGDESRGDAEFVQEWADRLGLPCHRRVVDLSTVSGNLEQEARRARLSFFHELMANGDVDKVATGHTRSDQAETVLFRLLRGSAGAGLAGIRPVAAPGLIRPLLGVGREEVREYLRERGLPWREDSSNQSLDFARNRIRQELMPLLASQWNPAIEEALAHTADWAYEEECREGTETARLAEELFRSDGGSVLIRADALAGLPRAVARRLTRLAVERVKGDTRSMAFDHVEAVLALVEDAEGGKVSLPGVTVCRSFDWIRFAVPLPASEWRAPAPVPGCVPLPGGNLAISLEIVDNSETFESSHSVYNGREMGCLDWNRLPGSRTLRSWQHGDRYQPLGATGETKLKDLFQQARVPIWEREGWPVLEVGDRIAWSRRFGTAAWCAAGPDSRVVLRVREVCN
jgi:tRNA(Ile)-lysidine synthase